MDESAGGPHVTTLDTSNIRGQITHHLRAAILAGELKGDHVYSAPMLASRFGVSATPVREAMIDLAKDGIVEAVRNKGFRVVLPSTEQLQQILEARLMLEVPTVRRVASQGLSQDQWATARHLADASVDAVRNGDLVTHVAADMRFHLYLLGLSGNQEIVDIVRILRSRGHLFGLRSPQNRSFLLKNAQEHHDLLESIAGRRERQAAEILDAHLRHAGEVWFNPRSKLDVDDL